VSKRDHPTGSDVVLLLHCDGTDASTTFTDSEVTPKTVTANGNAQLDTAQSKFGTASGLFDGSGDSLSVPDSPDWDFGTGDFTIDFQVAFAATGGDQNFINQRSADATDRAWAAYKSAANTFIFNWVNSTTAGTWTDTFTTPFVVSANTFNHVAIVRSSNSLMFFKDGVQMGTSYNVTGHNFRNAAQPVWIGANPFGGASEFFNGWIDEIRISKGIARWSSNFTAPTEEYSTSSPSAPDAITNLLSSTGLTVTTAGLTWSTPAGVPTLYQVQRETPVGGGFATLTDVGTVNYFNDQSTVSGVQYNYRMYAVNAIGSSAVSNTSFVTIPTSPAVATALIASSSLLATTSNLSWTAPSSDGGSPLTNYRIESSTGGGFAFVGNVAAGTLSLVDSSTVASKSYYYRMYAINAIGSSGVSSTSNTVTIPTSPVAIANVSASLLFINSSNITWSAPSDNGSPLTNYRINYKINAGAYSELATVLAGTLSYTHLVTYGSAYTYAVYAINAIGTSSISNEYVITAQSGGSTTRNIYMRMRNAEGI